MDKILGIFDKRPLIWLHYILLVMALFISFYIGQEYFNLSKQGTLWMFIFWYISISISDQLIHSKYILNVD